MTPFDILLLVVGLFLVIFLTVQRMLRALLTLVVVWISVFVSTMAYRKAASFFLGVLGENLALLEGVFFIFFFVAFLVIGYILMHSAFPVTRLPKLGVMDYLMGLLLGLVVTVIVVAVLQNGLILMVRVPWEGNEANFASFAPLIRESGLREFNRGIMSAFNVTFQPFFNKLPPALQAF